MELAARVARALEAGRGGLPSAVAAHVWGAIAARSLVKSLTFPAHKRVIVVGGSTLGGSGKTPLAIACAKQLALDGHRVAFVGHAYRARPERSRVVAPDDEVERVGDEALVAARALIPLGVTVTVAPTRQAALDHALAGASIAIVDGVAQLTPHRANLALLAVDASRPWGSGSCPPSGDLRAPQSHLLDVCDRLVRVGPPSGNPGAGDQPIDEARPLSLGASLGDRKLDWDELRRLRIGVWTTIARPERVLARLAGLHVTAVLNLARTDHADSTAADLEHAMDRAGRAGVDLWLCTAKCATHLPTVLGNVPVATLAYELSLGEALVGALRDAIR